MAKKQVFVLIGIYGNNAIDRHLERELYNYLASQEPQPIICPSCGEILHPDDLSSGEQLDYKCHECELEFDSDEAIMFYSDEPDYDQDFEIDKFNDLND